MIRDIVVHLNVGAKASPASDFAISVAAAFNAHLTGIAFLYDSVVPVSSVGLLPAEDCDAARLPGCGESGPGALRRRKRKRCERSPSMGKSGLILAIRATFAGFAVFAGIVTQWAVAPRTRRWSRVSSTSCALLVALN